MSITSTKSSLSEPNVPIDPNSPSPHDDNDNDNNEEEESLDDVISTDYDHHYNDRDNLLQVSNVTPSSMLKRLFTSYVLQTSRGKAFTRSFKMETNIVGSW